MIVINGRFTTQQVTGVQRASYELARRLVDIRTDVRIVSPAPPLEEYDLPVEVVPGWPKSMRGHLWEQLVLRNLIGESDLLLNIGGTGPILTNAKQAVMIYDANYILGPAAYSRSFRLGYRLIQGWHAKRSSICTISSWSALTIGKAYGIDADEIEIIPCAADHVLTIKGDYTVCERYNLSRPFLLCVGSANPNKNFSRVIEAYRLIDNPIFDLVIVGGGASAFAKIPKRTDGAGIRSLGYVADEELIGLYRAATAYVMPSLLEGFGIPALEAMSLGCPVIASQTSALPEVCSKAAMYFDPLSAGDIAEKMCQVTLNSDLRHQLSQDGMRRATEFNWQFSAVKLSHFLDRIM